MSKGSHHDSMDGLHFPGVILLEAVSVVCFVLFLMGMAGHTSTK